MAHGACVWTQRQTHGQGRNGSTWRSPPGVLTASFVLRVANVDADAGRLSLLAGLATCYAIEDAVAGARVHIKWPNDCVVDGRKLAGILCARAPSDELSVVVGIGLNVDPIRRDPDAWRAVIAIGGRSAISLDELCINPPEMSDLLKSMRRYLLEAAAMLTVGGWERLLNPLRERDWLRGKRLNLDSAGELVSGVAAGIGDDGRLRVRMESEERSFASAHILAVE
mgnify:CR=1 FL=1